MLRFLPPVARGAIAFLLLGLNTLLWCIPLFALSMHKLLLPAQRLRQRIDPLLNAIATRWIDFNRAWMSLGPPISWDVEGVRDLRHDSWYMVNCNHRSWVDIFVLQRVLNRRIPLLKFFLKQQLIYVPVIGLAWWALDFPFMKRHAKADLRKRPELRNQDRETTLLACRKFSRVPTSVMTFAEGTRFTRRKHSLQNSPYRHLLKPKAGALGLALNAIGDKFRSLIDVTIVYPDGTPSLWEFACGRKRRVIVRVRQLPIPAEFTAGDYAGDPALRSSLHRWVSDLWEHKDRQIDTLLVDRSPARG
jgi:1-acyl-sn-glycerol-3-phosphate acyltransferase